MKTHVWISPGTTVRRAISFHQVLTAHSACGSEISQSNIHTYTCQRQNTVIIKLISQRCLIAKIKKETGLFAHVKQFVLEYIFPKI